MNFNIGDRVKVITDDDFNGELGTITGFCGLVCAGGIWIELDCGAKFPFDPHEIDLINVE